jgi:hypothetical protein
VWWGSYIGYGYEACQGPPAVLPVKPDYFQLTIWDDVPAGIDLPYSHPNDIIWEYRAVDFDEVLVGYDKQPHGAPNEPVFRYSVRLPRDDWFLQRDANTVYWFSVVAVYEDVPDYNWGWTNHEHMYNDDAVSGVLDASGEWVWDELYDQNDASEDMSFILFTEPGCFPCAHPDYFEWLDVGKPDCWCYPRQCHGDADGKQTTGFPPYYWVSIPDLGILKSAWNKELPALVGNEICADFDHMQTTGFPPYYRVSIPDLTILKTYWNDTVTPDPNCLAGY